MMTFSPDRVLRNLRIGHRVGLVLMINILVAVSFVVFARMAIDTVAGHFHEALELHQGVRDVRSVHNHQMRVLLGIRQYLFTMDLKKADRIQAEAKELEGLIGGILSRDPVLREELERLRDLIEGILPVFEQVLEHNVAIRLAYDEGMASAQNFNGLITIARSNARDEGVNVLMPPLDRVTVRFQDAVWAFNRLYLLGTCEPLAGTELGGVEKAMPVLTKLAGNEFQFTALSKASENLVDFREALDRLSHKLASRGRLVKEGIDERQERIDAVIDSLLSLSTLRETEEIENISAALPEIALTFSLLAIGLMMLSGILTWAVARSITRPLAVLDRAIQAQSDGSKDLELPDDTGKDELAGMARTLRRAVMLQEERNRLIEDLQRAQEETERSMEALARAKESAESANRAKSEFLATMSHELRTPLHQIIGFTELVTMEDPDALGDKQRRYLDLSIRSGNHLLSLIDDILDISRIEAGKARLNLGEVDLAALIEESVALAREKATRSRVTLTTEVDDVPASIEADGRMLKQILTNLLSNAVKFTGQGGSIVLTARRRSREDDGGTPDAGEFPEAGSPAREKIPHSFIHVTVSDNGMGIAAGDLERIFNPFVQVDSSLSRRFEGTGLGLALTKEFVQLHGGRVWAESRGPGEGACFHFTIPLARRSAETG